jgi:hypothetical protein
VGLEFELRASHLLEHLAKIQTALIMKLSMFLLKITHDTENGEGDTEVWLKK